MNQHRKSRPWAARFAGIPGERLIWYLVALAAGVRILFVLAAQGIGDPNSMDAQNYLEIARNLASGNGFSLGGGPTTFVAPVYPVILGLILALGGSIAAVKLLQAVVGGLSVWLVFRLARHFFSERAALLAAIVFAFHPEPIAITAFIYTETWFIFLLLASVLALINAMERGSGRLYAVAGLSLGITTLCRGIPMYFPVFLALLPAFYPRLRRRWAVHWLSLVAAMALVILPWTVRNYVHFHAFVPVATGAGDVFWTGNYLPFDGEFRYRETQEKIRELTGGASLIERDRILMHEALENMKKQPLRTLILWGKKLGRYWFRVYENVPRGSERKKNVLIWGVLAAVHFTLLALFVLGLKNGRWREPQFGVAAALILYFTAIHVVTLPVPRYRMPLIPFMAIFAASVVEGWLPGPSRRDSVPAQQSDVGVEG